MQAARKAARDSNTVANVPSSSVGLVAPAALPPRSSRAGLDWIGLGTLGKFCFLKFPWVNLGETRLKQYLQTPIQIDNSDGGMLGLELLRNFERFPRSSINRHGGEKTGENRIPKISISPLSLGQFG